MTGRIHGRWGRGSQLTCDDGHRPTQPRRGDQGSLGGEDRAPEYSEQSSSRRPRTAAQGGRPLARLESEEKLLTETHRLIRESRIEERHRSRCRVRVACLTHPAVGRTLYSGRRHQCLEPDVAQRHPRRVERRRRADSSWRMTPSRSFTCRPTVKCHPGADDAARLAAYRQWCPNRRPKTSFRSLGVGLAGSRAMTTLADDLVPDQLWALVEPLLPVPPRPPYGGRHRTIPDPEPASPRSCTWPAPLPLGGCCPLASWAAAPRRPAGGG